MVRYKVRYGVLSSESISDRVLVNNPLYGENISGFGSRPIKPIKQVYDKLEAESQFFTKLEKSILSEGFINPVLCYSIDKGVYPYYGGNRIMIAQKHNLNIPCIISDYVNRFKDLELLETEDDIRKKFSNQPKIDINEDYIAIYGCKHIHL